MIEIEGLYFDAPKDNSGSTAPKKETYFLGKSAAAAIPVKNADVICSPDIGAGPNGPIYGSPVTVTVERAVNGGLVTFSRCPAYSMCRSKSRCPA